jgi:integrase
MFSLTLARLNALRPGAALSDPAVTGLRYIRQRQGLYAQLRFKGADGWRSYGLGKVDIDENALLEQIETAAFLTRVLGPPPDDLRKHQPKEVLELGLEPVRRAARELRIKLRSGEVEAPTGPTFGDVAHVFLERYVAKKMRPRSQKEYARGISRFMPAWQHRPIKSITRADIEAELDKLEDKHGPVARNRALANVGSLFTFALKREAIPASPALKIDMLPEKPRERWLRDNELERLWAAFDALRYPWGLWGKLLCLTAQRREQCAQMQWEDIDFANAVWYARQKGDRALLVPLGPMALALLHSLRPTDGSEPTGYVFTTGRTRGKKAGGQSHIQGFNYAKGLVEEALSKDGPPLAQWQFHDIRRTVSTGLSRLRVPPHIRELVLGHAALGRLQKTYDQHDYLDEKRAALEAWEAHLAAVGCGGNVTPLHTPRRGMAIRTARRLP